MRQSPKARIITYTASTDESRGWRGDGDAKQWCNDHYRCDGATSGTTTVPASDDVYVGGDTGFRDYQLMQRAATESLRKDPTAATTTINDDSDVTTVSLSADASVTEGENITYTATRRIPRMAR
ncbi:hypothetical protein OK016_00095 [Vibrio chagasii]|nr:hypothetical protein [Vibrio chagasii]